MVETMEFSSYGEALGDASAVVRANAASAGLGAEVPTCPGWVVADLVTHVGVVWRWSGDLLRGEDPPPDAVLAREASASGDLLGWFDDALVHVLNGLAGSTAEPPVRLAFPAAPPARLTWARRLAHEASIHGVDAMSARLGRPPRVDELWFGRAFAEDGVAELLGLLAPTPGSPAPVPWAGDASSDVRASYLDLYHRGPAPAPGRTAWHEGWRALAARGR